MYKYLTTNNLSIALFFSAAAWGLFWIPLRQVEALGISGSWTVVIFNAIPLIVLIPIFLLTFKKYDAFFRPTIYSAIFIGLAITFYSKGLVETSVVRATLLFYLTPIWSTIFGIIWLSENLTLTRIISIIIAFLGMFLLLSGTNNSGQPLASRLRHKRQIKNSNGNTSTNHSGRKKWNSLKSAGINGAL